MTSTRLTDLAVDSLTVGGQPVGSGAGIVLLASGTIASPVAYFDLTLPAGYDQFSVGLFGIVFSAQDLLAGAFSLDAGATFECDATNFDTYTNLFVNAPSGANGTPATTVYADSLMGLSDIAVSGLAIRTRAFLDIDPGDASHFATLRARAMGTINGSPANQFSVTEIGQVVNPAATVAPTTGRVNLLRVLPYGNGDCNPPTSDHTITAGSYFLWGVPTP